MASPLYYLGRSAFILTFAIVAHGVLAATSPPLEIAPDEVIKAAFEAPPAPVEVALQKPEGSPVDALCGLLPANLNVSRGDHTRAFKVLVDKGPPDETKVFLRISRLTVDADGSSRAYHPDDPIGIGICEPGRQNACAVDKLPNADVVVLRGATKINGQDKAAYTAAWTEAWMLIKKNPKVSFTHQTDPRIPPDFALYYFKDANLTVVFKTTIIPFQDGAPCMRGPNLTDPGYFVAATSFKKPLRPRNICDPTRYLDASREPFVVVPGDTFDNLHTGDIAVAFIERTQLNELFFGIVGDKGPPFKTAEASIALNSKILRRTKPLVNESEQSDIDISLPKDDITAMGVLILVGSAVALNGDYSADNVAKVGNRFLKRWSMNRDPNVRLASCLKAAPVNPRDE